MCVDVEQTDEEDEAESEEEEDAERWACTRRFCRLTRPFWLAEMLSDAAIEVELLEEPVEQQPSGRAFAVRTPSGSTQSEAGGDATERNASDGVRDWSGRRDQGAQLIYPSAGCTSSKPENMYCNGQRLATSVPLRTWVSASTACPWKRPVVYECMVQPNPNGWGGQRHLSVSHHIDQSVHSCLRALSGGGRTVVLQAVLGRLSQLFLYCSPTFLGQRREPGGYISVEITRHKPIAP